jgi:hypothetical protein
MRAALRAIGKVKWEIAVGLCLLAGWAALAFGVASLLGWRVWPFAIAILLFSIAGLRLIRTIVRDGLYDLMREPKVPNA